MIICGDHGPSPPEGFPRRGPAPPLHAGRRGAGSGPAGSLAADRPARGRAGGGGLRALTARGTADRSRPVARPAGGADLPGSRRGAPRGGTTCRPRPWARGDRDDLVDCGLASARAAGPVPGQPPGRRSRGPRGLRRATPGAAWIGGARSGGGPHGISENGAGRTATRPGRSADHVGDGLFRGACADRGPPPSAGACPRGPMGRPVRRSVRDVPRGLDDQRHRGGRSGGGGLRRAHRPRGGRDRDRALAGLGRPRGVGAAAFDGGDPRSAGPPGAPGRPPALSDRAPWLAATGRRQPRGGRPCRPPPFTAGPTWSTLTFAGAPGAGVAGAVVFRLVSEERNLGHLGTYYGNKTYASLWGGYWGVELGGEPARK